MYRLKDSYLSSEPKQSNNYIQNKFTFAGYDEKTKLVRVYYVKLTETLVGKKNKIEIKPIKLNKQEIPSNLSLADAVKTISYVFNQVSKKTNSKTNSLLCTQLSNQCLRQYHFTEIEDNKRKKEKCLPIFVIDGNPALLGKTELYSDYVDWYVPEISREEISNAFKEASLTMPRSTKVNFESDSEPGEE